MNIPFDNIIPVQPLNTPPTPLLYYLDFVYESNEMKRKRIREQRRKKLERLINETLRIT